MSKLKDRLPTDPHDLIEVFRLHCSPQLLAGRIEAVERLRQAYAAILESDIAINAGAILLCLLEFYADLYTAGLSDLAEHCAEFQQENGIVLRGDDYRVPRTAHEAASLVYAAAERRKRAAREGQERAYQDACREIELMMQLATAELDGPGS
jgi:hypothetical protein